MKIDFYCFWIESLNDTKYHENGLTVLEDFFCRNLNFDVKYATEIKKCLFFVEDEAGFFWQNQKVNIIGKKILPRCEQDLQEHLIDKIEEYGGVSLITKEDIKKICYWPNYIQPLYRECKVVSKREFIQDFDKYKSKYGRVFFKTLEKNFDSEVLDIQKIDVYGNNPVKKDANYDGFDQDWGLSFVITPSSDGDADLRFSVIEDDAPVIVSPFIEILKYKNVNVEFRVFVLDRQITNICRRECVDTYVPDEVYDFARRILLDLPLDFPKFFVLDILQFLDNGKIKLDLADFNNLVFAVYEENNSIFGLENKHIKFGENKFKFFENRKKKKIDGKDKTDKVAGNINNTTSKEAIKANQTLPSFDKIVNKHDIYDDNVTKEIQLKKEELLNNQNKKVNKEELIFNILNKKK